VTVDNTRNSLTRLEERNLLFEKGMPLLQEGDRLNLVSVTARDRSSSSPGLLRCLDLERGAFASSFAHDSHNILVVGRDPEEMAIAANELEGQDGGMVLVHNSAPLVRLPLPVLSLLSDDPFEEVAEKVEALEEALRRFGMRHARPFLILSLLSLSVSPYYKFTDRGIVDTEARRILSPIVGAGDSGDGSGSTTNSGGHR
jgi:adenine deaminase